MKEKLCCKECGQSLKSYWSYLNTKLAKTLQTFYAKAGTNEARFADIFAHDTSSFGNFQKLQYWGLVIKHGGGIWSVSARGVQFLRGQITVPKKVYTVQGVVERVGKTEVFIKDVLREKSGWQTEFKAVRLPVRKKGNQRGLF